MKMTTEDGRTVNLGLAHQEIIIEHPKTKQPVKTRQTAIWFRADGNKDHPSIYLEANVICKPGDQFCRRTGRQLARKRFMPMLTNPTVTFCKGLAPQAIAAKISHFCRNDRRKIYQYLLPEYHTNQSPRKQHRRMLEAVINTEKRRIVEYASQED